jgi:hypothetical protein
MLALGQALGGSELWNILTQVSIDRNKLDINSFVHDLVVVVSELLRRESLRSLNP